LKGCNVGIINGLFMMYAIEVGSDGMVYTSCSMTICSRI
jgi:hypothetical protein